MNYLLSRIGYLCCLSVVGICALPVLAWADMAEAIGLPQDVASAIHLPAGFKAEVFANIKAAGSDYFRGPRFMAFGPDGNLYVSTGMDNKVLMLPNRNHDGVADEVVTVADNLNTPQGLAFVNGKLLVANQDGVVSLRQQAGRWPATGSIPLIRGLASGGHTLKTIKIGPDGYLYITVGSSCNVCVESDPTRATILRYTVEGKEAGALVMVGRHTPSAIWASGLRNSEGMAWQPQTGVMFATNNGADMRSATKGGKADDEIPPEHLNRIQAGKNYGWPHCWGDHKTDPNFPYSKNSTDNFCATTEAPAITFTSHSAPLGMTFLDKTAFPDDYKNDAIVALHGSWNRAEPSGYKLVRVEFEQNKPVKVIDFATGWLAKDQAWGRPVDVVTGPDGALYVSDDRAGLIYRISYGGKPETDPERKK